MADIKQTLLKLIQSADLVSKWADEAQSFKTECAELQSRTVRLSALLRQAHHGDLYDRPARRIVDDTGQVLEKALSLVDKCRAHGLIRRVLTIIPAGAFRKATAALDSSVGDVSWLIRVSSSAGGSGDDFDTHIGLPPIAQNEPILYFIWEQIAVLQNGDLDARADAAVSLVSLARDNDRYVKLIIEEDGVAPLLRLLKEAGRPEAQESAAHVLGFLGRDAESVEKLVLAGAVAALAKALKEATMKVQAMVAWAVAELAGNHPKCQDVFAQHNVVRLLVGHLAFETVEEASKYALITSKMSIHSAVINSRNVAAAAATTPSSSASGARAPREREDPATKARMKAMAALALGRLVRGNLAICRSITESKALLCFAVLLDKGCDGADAAAAYEVRYNSAVALMEICRVAEQHGELRRL